MCNNNGIPMQTGLSVGFWEAVWVVEVTRTPYCFISLGGLKLFDSVSHGTQVKVLAEEGFRSSAFYHVHQYRSPILALLKLFTDWGCMQMGDFDVGYISEVDPTFSSDAMTNFMNPEIFLLSGAPATMACASECVSATSTKKSINSLFWCSGCQGNIYPLSGHTAYHTNGISTALLLTSRTIAKLHKTGQAPRTATDSSTPNGELCRVGYAPRIIKNQYRIQPLYPVVGDSCQPIGASDVLWGSGKEFPQKGEDFAFIVWRKKNCCLL
jgi:conjugal transfer pilus assembly protein TraU